MLKPLKSVNPYTEETIATYEQTSPAELENALTHATVAFHEHRRLSVQSRARLLLNLADTLDTRKEELAVKAVQEMGKTITAARSEVEKCAMTARFFADHLAELLADIPVQEKPKRQFIRQLPLGPILAVMPWNFPYWQVLRAAIPALGAGNVMLLKHASNVSGCALLIEDVFTRAGFNTGVFQTLLLKSSRVQDVLADPRIIATTLTGSETAGSSVAKTAGHLLKKAVLELGGSDAFLVMPSASFEMTVQSAVTARMINNGQSCIAAKRFIVHSDIYERFVEAFAAKLEELVVGDPMNETTVIGPMVSRTATETLTRQLGAALDAGCRLRCGGDILDSRNLFAPTILLAPDFKATQPDIMQEEFFGPVGIVYRARDLTHAIEIANSSPFGLGSSIWTNDMAEAEYAIQELEAGLTFVNSIVASEPQLPFGGIKKSGYGHELGYLGFREFLNLKSVSFAPES